MSSDPQVIIRMGSHAEKEYVLKLNQKVFDGIIVGANIVEATAGATASLLGKKLSLPYYIDPMTYVFGCNLDGIRSEQKRKGKTVVAYKKAYKKLANRLGPLFSDALEKNKRITTSTLNGYSISELCENVAVYQLTRIREEFSSDDEYKEYADSITSPASIFCPYFYIPYKYDDGLDLFFKISSETARIISSVPVHAVLCADGSLMNDNLFVNKIIEETANTGIDAIWLWFSKFDEWDAAEESLRNFKRLVEELSKKGLKVYNRHGGYFSLILNKVGMAGISHGIGYGEKKDVLQVKGPPNQPIVHYYLPDIHKRYGVPDIERCFDEFGLETPDDFHEYICDCVICKGVVENDLSDFQDFGETHYATPTSLKPTQTPAAAKRCRYHFLMNRTREKDFIGKNNLATIKTDLVKSIDKWESCEDLVQHKHIERWARVLDL